MTTGARAGLKDLQRTILRARVRFQTRDQRFDRGLVLVDQTAEDRSTPILP
jgi:hypothetical protein